MFQIQCVVFYAVILRLSRPVWIDHYVTHTGCCYTVSGWNSKYLCTCQCHFCLHIIYILKINYLKAKCQKALQLLCVVAHTDWRADQPTLLKLYRSLVRSKLDNGCFIYGSARKSYLRCLDSIHHLGLRLALGALRTSPVESLYVEANGAPLSLRREKLTLQYYTKLSSILSIQPCFWMHY